MDHPHSFSIRRARVSEAAEILAFGKAIMSESRFTLTEADELTMTAAEEEEWIEQHLKHPGKAMFVAEADGKIIGMIDFRNGHRRRIAHHGEFGMSVAHEWRGMGVGTALLQTLIDWSKANPLIEKLDLRVHADNPIAIRLYEKFGFRQEGKLIRDLKLGPNHYVDSLIMGLLLK